MRCRRCCPAYNERRQNHKFLGTFEHLSWAINSILTPVKIHGKEHASRNHFAHMEVDLHNRLWLIIARTDPTGR